MLGKKLFVFIIALTLAFSVVNSVDPFFLNHTKAFADKGSDDNNKDEKQNDDNSDKEHDKQDNSGDSNNDNNEDSANDNGDEKDNNEDSNNNDNSNEKDNGQDDNSQDSNDDNSAKDDHNDNKDEKSEDKLVQQLGDNSKASLKVEDGAKLEVEIEDGDLADGMYDVQFSCTSPEVDKTFNDAITVKDGNGESESKLDLAEGTYSGCEVKVGDLSASFNDFTVAASEEDNGEGNDHEQAKDHEQKSKSKIKVEHDGVEIKVKMEGLSAADGLYDVVFSCEEPSVEKTFADSFKVENGKGEFETKFDLAEGTYNGCKITTDDTVVTFDPFTVLDKQVRESTHDREQEIVSTNTGKEMHERHMKAQPASPGPYEPGLEYMLAAAGTAKQGDTVSDAELNMDTAVWKSNSALVLLDILGGDVKIGDKTYEIVLGYGLFSMNSDTLRARAFVVDDAGDVFVLKLRGEAEMHDGMSEPGTELDTLHLKFDGNSGPSKNELDDWELFLDGAIQKSEG